MKLYIVALSYFCHSSAVNAEECNFTDDWTFKVNGEPGRGCGWVGRNPDDRCLISNGAKDACEKTCCGINDEESEATPPPSEATPPPPPPPGPPVAKYAAPLYNQYDVCTDFCKGATTACEGVVDWVTNTYPNPLSRNLDGGAGTNATGKHSEQFGACHDTCMGWMYWRQDAQPDFSQRFVEGYSIGDSLNCRYNHLMFAQGLPSFGYGIAASESESAAEHCNHITPDGGWVCTDYRNADNKTPGQLYRDATFTKHRVGDCWLAADDKIADCHRKAITDASVDQNLLWVPDDIEYIFLNVNSLTKVPDLSRFTELKGIYLENNAIDTLSSDDFANNTKLEIINVNNNFIADLPADIFFPLPKLKAFFATFNYIPSLSVTQFQNNPELEMLAVVDNSISEFELGTFDGLASLQLLAISQQANGVILEDDGLPDGLFNDLVSLEYLSSFINGVGTLRNSLFGDWSANLEAMTFFLLNTYPVDGIPLVIEDGVFDKLPNLIHFASYTSGNVINPTDVSNNTKIRTVLYGSQFDILTPLPRPDINGNAGY